MAVWESFLNETLDRVSCTFSDIQDSSRLKLPQFGGHLQVASNEKSMLWQENTTLWSIENRSRGWCNRVDRLRRSQWNLE